eukprot:TRINITY_DN48155_c0_g1_i1.p1 TRINITY_DN48155_c0_g1~~TRINITY_DN48155_c0_g1_i1.p1  ORF type:complete len:342 (+),score=8.27 TRINITY_DN48155_c0_g1_i1:59-1084(+)
MSALQTGLSAAVAFTAGLLIVVQAGANSELALRALGGGIPAEIAVAALSFTVGLCLIWIPVSLRLAEKPRSEAVSRPWYVWVGGGFCGGTFIVSTVILTVRLGVAAYFLLSVTGSLISSLVLDANAFLCLQHRPVTLNRVAGVCVLLLGAVLLRFEGLSDLPKDSVLLPGLWAFGVGWLGPLQGVLNRHLQDAVGSPFRAASVSYFCGTMLLLPAAIVCVIERPLSFRDAPWWSFVGGFCGLLPVTGGVIALPVLGAGLYMTLLITGQLVTAFFFDVTGAMRYTRHPLTVQSAVGVLLALSGVAMFQLGFPNFRVKTRSSTPIRKASVIDLYGGGGGCGAP